MLILCFVSLSHLGAGLCVVCEHGLLLAAVGSVAVVLLLFIYCILLLLLFVGGLCLVLV